MISSKKFDSSVVDGTLTRFLSDFIIATEQHVRVYNYVYDSVNGSDTTDVLDPAGSGLFVRATDNPTSSDLQGLDKWDLVTNSILFYVAPPTTSSVFLEVATTPEEFGGTLVQPSVERAEAAAVAAGESEEAAALSESNAAASEVQTGLDAIATSADVVTTNADVVLTNADVANINGRLDTVQSNSNTVEQNIEILTDEPVASQLAGAEANATTAQLEAWIAEAEAMTSGNLAHTAENVFVKAVTSNGDGTFTETTTPFYSSLHYATKATSGGTDRTSARNTVISSPNGVLAINGTTVDVLADNIISYAEGTNPVSGDLDSIETTTLTSNMPLFAGVTNYIRIDKGGSPLPSQYPLIKVERYTVPDANSDIYDVSEGVVHHAGTGLPISRVYLGEVVVDASGDIIPETLIEYQVKHLDVAELEVYGKVISNYTLTARCTISDAMTAGATLEAGSVNVSAISYNGTSVGEVLFSEDMDNIGYTVLGESSSATEDLTSPTRVIKRLDGFTYNIVALNGIGVGTIVTSNIIVIGGKNV